MYQLAHLVSVFLRGLKLDRISYPTYADQVSNKGVWTEVVDKNYHQFQIRAHKIKATPHGPKFSYELWKRISPVFANATAVQRDTKFVEEITGRRLRVLKEKGVREEVKWVGEDELEMWQIDFYHQSAKRRERLPLAERSLQDMEFPEPQGGQYEHDSDFDIFEDSDEPKKIIKDPKLPKKVRKRKARHSWDTDDGIDESLEYYKSHQNPDPGISRVSGRVRKLRTFYEAPVSDLSVRAPRKISPKPSANPDEPELHPTLPKQKVIPERLVIDAPLSGDSDEEILPKARRDRKAKQTDRIIYDPSDDELPDMLGRRSRRARKPPNTYGAQINYDEDPLEKEKRANPYQRAYKTRSNRTRGAGRGVRTLRDWARYNSDESDHEARNAETSKNEENHENSQVSENDQNSVNGQNSENEQLSENDQKRENGQNSENEENSENDQNSENEENPKNDQNSENDDNSESDNSDESSDEITGGRGAYEQDSDFAPGGQKTKMRKKVEPKPKKSKISKKQKFEKSDNSSDDAGGAYERDGDFRLYGKGRKTKVRKRLKERRKSSTNSSENSDAEMRSVKLGVNSVKFENSENEKLDEKITFDLSYQDGETSRDLRLRNFDIRLRTVSDQSYQNHNFLKI